MNRDQASQLQKGGNLFFISSILDLQTNQLIRNRMLNYPFIRSLSVLLDNVTTLIHNSSEQNNEFSGAASDTKTNASSQSTRMTDIALEFQYTLLLIAESISTNQKVILQMHDAIISFLMPVLLTKVRQPSLRFPEGSSADAQERDSKFLSLKIITDVIT